MSSLVAELQRDALDSRVPVAELLRKCLVVATKLGVEEFASWVHHELDGYKGIAVPEYRIVYGAPQVFNPYHGYQPLNFGDSRQAEICSKMNFNQPIGEIEHDLRGAERAGPGSFQVSYPPAKERALMNAMEFPLQPSLHVNSSQLHKILEAVRKVVLEWSLKLEADGILGDGLTFSREEREKAQMVTYNIKNSIHGNVEQSQIQVESISAVQDMSTKSFDISELKEVLRSIRLALDELSLAREDKEELLAEMSTLDSQANSPKPKSPIIRESLSSVRRILEGAAGKLVAAGILSKIGALFGP